MEYLRDKINELYADIALANKTFLKMEMDHKYQITQLNNKISGSRCKLFTCSFCRKDVTVVTPLFLMSSVKLDCNVCKSESENLCSFDCGHVCCQLCCDQLHSSNGNKGYESAFDFDQPLTSYMLDAFHSIGHH